MQGSWFRASGFGVVPLHNPSTGLEFRVEEISGTPPAHDELSRAHNLRDESGVLYPRRANRDRAPLHGLTPACHETMRNQDRALLDLRATLETSPPLCGIRAARSPCRVDCERSLPESYREEEMQAGDTLSLPFSHTHTLCLALSHTVSLSVTGTPQPLSLALSHMQTWGIRDGRARRKPERSFSSTTC